MSSLSDEAWVRYRTSLEKSHNRRKSWVKRIPYALATGVLFGLLIPTWETIKTFTLTALILSGILITGLILRDYRITRKFRMEWSSLVEAETGDRLRMDKPEGR